MQEAIEEPFEFLGLDKNCREADVLKAWRRMARQYHPDKTGASDSTVMHEIETAKDIERSSV
jgi:curved DNA-binding protein CbpA